MVENKKNGLERLNKKSGKKVVQIEWKSSTKMVKRQNKLVGKVVQSGWKQEKMFEKYK